MVIHIILVFTEIIPEQKRLSAMLFYCGERDSKLTNTVPSQALCTVQHRPESMKNSLRGMTFLNRGFPQCTPSVFIFCSLAIFVG